MQTDASAVVASDLLTRAASTRRQSSTKAEETSLL